MIIDTYNVAMNSSRKSSMIRTTETEEKRKQNGSNITTKINTKDILTISDEAKEYFSKNKSMYLNGSDTNVSNDSGYEFTVNSDSDENVQNDENESGGSDSNAAVSLAAASNEKSGSALKIDDVYTMKLKALLQLLRSLTQSKNKKGSYDYFDKLSELSDNLRGLKKESMFSETVKSVAVANNDSVGSNTLVWKVEKRESVFTQEQEVTAFQSTGIAKTADGREISFNVDIEMSRSFEEYIENYTSKEVVLKDPLVINLDSAPANISDQTFLFDIDADGEEEEISQLGKGSGFLALDKNGDGIINDGNELFGAMTGNGFKELAQYDDDGNGWIDEADEIFNKLTVWTKDENGKDILLSLKDADLGAIYLGNVSTEFSVNDVETNQQNAQVRKTGIYLKESGGAGSIQQIDFAVRNEKAI